MKNPPLIGVVASLLVLLAVALWQLSVLTSDGRLGGPYPGGKPENGPIDNNQVKPALSQSPKQDEREK